MNNIEIREIFTTQIEEYRTFISIALEEDGNNLLITPKDNEIAPFPTKDRPDSFTLGAYLKDTLAGVASFNRDGDGKEKLQHKGFLSTMYVSKQFRGLGIAGLLLQEIIARSKALSDIEQINLIVLSENIKAKHLYEKSGFRKFGTEINSIKANGRYFSEDFMVLHFNNETSITNNAR